MQGQVNGKRYRVGRSEWAKELNLVFADKLQAGLTNIEERAESAIALLDDKQVLALFGLADQVREQARTAVERLQEIDIQVVMITGDAEAVAKTVALSRHQLRRCGKSNDLGRNRHCFEPQVV